MFGFQKKSISTFILIVLFSVSIFSCSTNSSNEKKEETAKEAEINADTKKMIDRIAEIYSQIEPINYPSMNTRRAEIFRKALDSAKSQVLGANLYFLYCDELL